MCIIQICACVSDAIKCYIWVAYSQGKCKCKFMLCNLVFFPKNRDGEMTKLETYFSSNILLSQIFMLKSKQEAREKEWEKWEREAVNEGYSVSI